MGGELAADGRRNCQEGYRQDEAHDPHGHDGREGDEAEKQEVQPLHGDAHHRGELLVKRDGEEFLIKDGHGQDYDGIERAHEGDVAAGTARMLPKR
jgi:hypothetical protein